MADPPRALVLDMEGVLHVDWAALPGAAGAVRRLAGAGIELAVLTNTTGHTRAAIAAQLDRMGIPIGAERIVTAAWAAAEHLRGHGSGPVYALVEPAVQDELHGIELVSSPADAEVIVLGGPDERWTYAVMNGIFRALHDGASLVAMHRNRWWTTAAGPALDAGMYVSGLEYAAAVEATVIGKPSPAIYETACALAGSDPAGAMMVGDDLESDLRPARGLGMATCLVRTGKGGSFAPRPGEVDVVCDDLAALAGLLLDPSVADPGR
jgi:HAD superfamily hydrolase (TIGR01458 family)